MDNSIFEIIKNNLKNKVKLYIIISIILAWGYVIYTYLMETFWIKYINGLEKTLIFGVFIPIPLIINTIIHRVVLKKYSNKKIIFFIVFPLNFLFLIYVYLLVGFPEPHFNYVFDGAKQVLEYEGKNINYYLRAYNPNGLYGENIYLYIENGTNSKKIKLIPNNEALFDPFGSVYYMMYPTKLNNEYILEIRKYEIGKLSDAVLSYFSIGLDLSQAKFITSKESWSTYCPKKYFDALNGCYLIEEHLIYGQTEKDYVDLSVLNTISKDKTLKQHKFIFFRKGDDIKMFDIWDDETLPQINIDDLTGWGKIESFDGTNLVINTNNRAPKSKVTINVKTEEVVKVEK